MSEIFDYLYEASKISSIDLIRQSQIGTISIRNKAGVLKVENWEKTIEVIQ